MTQNKVATWCEVLAMVPARWRVALCRFIEEGEATDEFLEFLEHDPQCLQACEMLLRADKLIPRLLSAAAEPEEVAGAGSQVRGT